MYIFGLYEFCGVIKLLSFCQYARLSLLTFTPRHHLQQENNKNHRDDDPSTDETATASTSTTPAQNRLTEQRRSLQQTHSGRPSYRNVFSTLKQGKSTSSRQQQPSTSAHATTKTTKSSDLSQYAETFNQIKELFYQFCNANVLTILKETFSAFKEAPDTISKTFALVGGAIHIFEAFNG